MSDIQNANGKPGVRGPGRTSREDWIRAAIDTLISEGVDQVKVLSLAAKLDCARSSFYWYFNNRADLLEALLEHWADTNTKAIVDAANEPADSINFALAQLYAGWITTNTFDTALDFAIRDWARRSDTVRQAIDVSDRVRIEAIAAMFKRHKFKKDEAAIRARVVYFTQIGYTTLDQRESWETRVSRSRQYLYCMTGVKPNDTEVRFLKPAAKKMRKPDRVEH